jgi:hypothetical protein
VNKFISIALLMSALLFQSCNKPVEACIDIDTTSAPVGTAITFTSCSKKALSFEWFMTGPTGAPENTKGWSEEIFVHSFTVPGTYIIELTAYKRYSWIGEKSTTTATITIN